MPLWLRRLLIALAVLVVLFAAAATYLAATFDANRYKGTLIDWVREHRQRTLKIDGPISLSVFPRLGLSLADVSLSEHRRADEFASLRSATLSVRLLPLLRKQLVVDRVAAQGVRVVYSRDANGVRNIDDLLAPGPAATTDAASAPASGAPSFDVSGIQLEDLQATVKDAILGIDGRFAVARLETGRLADGARSPVKLQAQATLAQPKLDASVDLEARLRLRLPAGAAASIELADAKLALKGQGFEVKALDARLAGTLGYDGASGAWSADGLALTLSGQRLGIALKDSRVAVKSLRFDPPKRALKLDALDVKLAGSRGAAAPFEATLAWPQLGVEGDRLQGAALAGSAALQGAQAVKLTFASQPPSGSFESIKLPGLKLTVGGSSAGRAVEGQLGADLTIAPTPFALAIDALAAQLRFTDPSIPPVALVVRGQARASAKDASATLAGSINEQKFDAKLRADLGRPLPFVDAQARFDALDLTRFVAPAKAGGEAKPAAAPQPAAAADRPVDLSALKAADARLALRAGSLVYPPYRIADATLDASIAGGRLELSRLAGRAWNGSFTASARAEAAAAPKDQRLAVKLDANGVDIAQLLGDVAQFRKLEGRGRVSADLATRGGSVLALKQALGGRAAMQLTDGAVRGVNLAKTLRQWRGAVSLNKDAVQASSADEKTDFSEIAASFDIDRGIARSKDLVAKSPFLRVGGVGAIDLVQGRIDYTARATVTGTPEGQGGADLEALKGVTVPVQLVGPFEQVDYKVQWSAVGAQVLAGAARGAFGDKVKGAVNDRLGGLLGTPDAPASGASAPGEGRPLEEAAKQRAKDELKKLFGR
ncbi:MAG TPA: AsmA family protein [Methylibium sp.]|uniref:AsmA family protein n=1 Tax=Methylibium sp. TaxID=2067992 RepID=UPI002DBDC2C9|nr:AsmA family protein [Methylibium sp.]HEU4460755.1 AsmA family protein [Methylibium sp.]